MVEALTRKRLNVESYGTAVPYIRLQVRQLIEVCKVLDKYNIRYWVDEDALSLNGGPETTYVNLDRKTVIAVVQSLLSGID